MAKEKTVQVGEGYNYFDEAGLDPRNQVGADDWVNLKEKIGTSVAGVFVGFWKNPPNPGFRQQVSVAIKTEDGTIKGVSVSEYMENEISESLPGDRVAFRYEGDKDTGKPKPLKVIKFYNKARLERAAVGQTVRSAAAPTVTGTDTDETDTGLDTDELDF